VGYYFEDDPTYLEYMKDGVMDTSIEKPVTINRLCQRVKEELDTYQVIKR
jgi:hypothetical protein